jgi:hypothetical protein
VGAASIVVVLQLFGSYELIRQTFRWLALFLFAYVAAALLARPAWGEVLRGTLMPHMRWDSEFLMMIVACIGTSLSAYIYTWQSNQEVEEQIAEGTPALVAAARRKPGRARTNAAGRDHRHDLLERHPLLHHPVDRSDAARRGADRHRKRGAGGRRARAPRGRGRKLLFAAGVVGSAFSRCR